MGQISTTTLIGLQPKPGGNPSSSMPRRNHRHSHTNSATSPDHTGPRTPSRPSRSRNQTLLSSLALVLFIGEHHLPLRALLLDTNTTVKASTTTNTTQKPKKKPKQTKGPKDGSAELCEPPLSVTKNRRRRS
ncbi:hypothetical protein F2Q68_00041872 [Brassica cretica]|uniref:Uncharacterized protein n=1 Tax=Brassica cretica TaxID=69181 RepID=A0A8S9MH88_BRACR|nr:hypothetical protein F2Q68_00041872 [Brassica cretica]